MDMKGKFPVRSLFTTPLISLANGPKQNTFATDLLSGINVASVHSPYAGPGYNQGSTKRGKRGGATCGTGAGTMDTSISPFVFTLIQVHLMTFFGHFMCPLAVLGLGFKYVMTSSLKRMGHPFKKPFCVAFRRDMILGLHRD
jgi:hypothetical protein